MLKVVMTRGIPGSGKTFWAKQQLADQSGGWKRISKDDLRSMLDGGKWSGPNERFVLKVRDHLIAEALRADKHVIVDDTNFEPRHRQAVQRVIDGLAPIQARIEIKDFTDVPLDTCLQRDTARANGVGADVILRMYYQYCAVPIVPTPRPDLPLAVICDLDGTLALCKP